MSKWYTVKVTIEKMALVEVDEEATELLQAAAAMDVVMEEHITDGSVEAQVDSGPFDAGTEEWEQAKEHADEVLKL